MTDSINRFLDPNQFFKLFSPGLTRESMSEVMQTESGLVPTHHIFSIMRVEEMGKNIQFPIPIGRSTVYEICWIKEGKMIRTNGLVNYEITQGNIGFWRAGVLKGTESLSEDAAGYYCFFDKDFVLQFLRDQKSLDELPIFRNNGRSLIQLNQKSNKAVRQLLDAIDKEFRGDLPERSRIMGLLLCQLLITGTRYSTDEPAPLPQSYGEILTKNFLSAIKLNSSEPRTVQHYATKLNVTANYLNKCVKKHTGKPATYHLSAMVVWEAKIMLKQTDLTVSEIASKLGFEDFSYFSRMFHKNAGVTPKQFRTQSHQPEEG